VLVFYKEVKMQCPKCNSIKIAKHGFVWRANEKVQRYRCQSCSKTFVLEILQDQVRDTLAKLVAAGLLEVKPGGCYKKTDKWDSNEAKATIGIPCDNPVTKL
jgi:DNA-directed RNA polymerase subunit RPC12/RpoP